MKKILIALAAVVAVVAIYFVSQRGAEAPTAENAAPANKWAKVRIATEGAYEPFNYKDANNNLIGFDVDIAKALCEKMKVECEIVEQDWDGIIPGLQEKKYDAIIASMSITEKRKEVVDFSNKYYQTPSRFAAKKGAGLQISATGLAGKRVGAQRATIQADYLSENFAQSEIKLYATIDEAYLDLAAGRLDAVLVDGLPLQAWLAKPEGAGFEMVGDNVLIGGGAGIAVRKEDTDLRDMFNKALEEILKDGTYKAINDKYFPFSIYN